MITRLSYTLVHTLKWNRPLEIQNKIVGKSREGKNETFLRHQFWASCCVNECIIIQRCSSRQAHLPIADRPAVYMRIEQDELAPLDGWKSYINVSTGRDYHVTSTPTNQPTNHTDNTDNQLLFPVSFARSLKTLSRERERDGSDFFRGKIGRRTLVGRFFQETFSGEKNQFLKVWKWLRSSCIVHVSKAGPYLILHHIVHIVYVAMTRFLVWA